MHHSQNYIKLRDHNQKMHLHHSNVRTKLIESRLYQVTRPRRRKLLNFEPNETQAANRSRHGKCLSRHFTQRLTPLNCLWLSLWCLCLLLCVSYCVSGSSCGWSCVSYCDSSNLTREFTTARLLRSQKKETIILFNPSFKCGKSRVLKFYAKSQPSHLCIYIYISTLIYLMYLISTLYISSVVFLKCLGVPNPGFF